MEYTKICKNPDCNKAFLGTKTQQYCCPDCRLVKGKYKQKEKKNAYSLEEITQQAREMGMSYGKYVAMQYEQERKRKR